MTAEQWRDLLGHDVVLLGWPLGSKGTKRPWGHLTASHMTPDYLKKLEGGNIGVALGEVSGGLVALDIDEDDVVGPFIAVNSFLIATLQTRGARGCVFWLRMLSEYPAKTIKLKTPSGNKCGEWRAGKNTQSIIAGIHPDTGKLYQVVKMAKPMVVDFANFVWPLEIANPPTLNSACCVPASLHPCIPESLHPLHNNANKILTSIVARTDAQKALAAKHPQLEKLYTNFIEPRFQAQAHGRNHFIVQSVPFLYRAVAPRFVMELVGCFYDCNRALFKDSREQHMKEADAMLKSVAKTYTESLGADEHKIYDALPQHEQDAFRICRDLALLKEPVCEPNTFFLSFNHLGDRLGIFPMQAQRIMRQLESYGLIKLLRKGTRRAVGVRGEAGSYQWLISSS